MSTNSENCSQSSEVVTRALARHFDAGEVRFKPQVVRGNRALAIPYIDARAIQDRLDEVLGVDGWQDEYTPLPDGSVICRLRLRVAGEWITKMDVGSPSEQPDSGDRMKAAFSDALKRAAVKFGVGRYLYRTSGIWVDYDSSKKQFVQPPALPVSPSSSPTSTPAPSPKTRSGAIPTDGAELLRRLHDFDEKLAHQGLCNRGALIERVRNEGMKAGHGSDLSAWSAQAIQFAVQQTRAFEASLRSRENNVTSAR